MSFPPFTASSIFKSIVWSLSCQCSNHCNTASYFANSCTSGTFNRLDMKWMICAGNVSLDKTPRRACYVTLHLHSLISLNADSGTFFASCTDFYHCTSSPSFNICFANTSNTSATALPKQSLCPSHPKSQRCLLH